MKYNDLWIILKTEFQNTRQALHEQMFKRIDNPVPDKPGQS